MLYGFIGKIKGGFMLKTIGNEGENLEQLIAETTHDFDGGISHFIFYRIFVFMYFYLYNEPSLPG
jgi:hypothetical protein